MNIAFGGEVSFKSVVDDLRNQLSKALENTGSKFSVTDVLAMKEDDIKKQFGEGVILKLYQSINEESKKMRSESLENLLGMIEDYKDYAQRIKDIERNLQKDLADIESQRGQLGEEATDKLIAQRKRKRAKMLHQPNLNNSRVRKIGLKPLTTLTDFLLQLLAG